MEDRRVNEKRLPENPVILENAPWYFAIFSSYDKHSLTTSPSADPYSGRVTSEQG